jgi:hypothetical protein
MDHRGQVHLLRALQLHRHLQPESEASISVHWWRAGSHMLRPRPAGGRAGRRREGGGGVETCAGNRKEGGAQPLCGSRRPRLARPVGRPGQPSSLGPRRRGPVLVSVCSAVL